jgi:hypothetical protein
MIVKIFDTLALYSPWGLFQYLLQQNPLIFKSKTGSFATVTALAASIVSDLPAIYLLC